ncbi:MAG TPA: urease accessory protein UreD [Nitrospiraceae bacterium]|nr:urease accessory protein UreD [Nitrospiraceae bacterium]
MNHSADGSSVLKTVGRRGALSYGFERAGPRTILARSSSTSPWHHFPPSYLDDSGCAYTWLVNPSGGLVGGDHVSVEAQLHAGTHVLMTSPSANRVYRSLSEPAVQEVQLSVGPEARLEWLPEVTIPFAGSRLRQSIHVDLAPGATVVLWDAIASGRVAMRERWAFAAIENEICIRTPLALMIHDGSSRNRAVALRDGHAEPRGPEAYLNSTSRGRAASLPANGSSQQRIRDCSRSAHESCGRGGSVVERYRLVPGRLPESVGLVGSWDYVASLFVIGDAVDADVWKRLDVVLAAILEQRPGLVLGAVSTPAAPGLAVKFVARSAPDLTETLALIWAAVRKDLWNLAVPNLRRY